METAIITAFEPFGEESINPTEAVIEHIPDMLYNTRIVKVTLPVVYNFAFDRLLPLIEEHQPKLIIQLGLALGRPRISIERVALNVNHADMADNLGNQKQYELIEPYGPDGLFTTLPLARLMDRLKEKGVPATVSNTAGGFVCNNLFYKTLHYVKAMHKSADVGFMHVPPLPKQAIGKNIASMEQSHMVNALMVVLDTMLNPVDIKKQAQKVTGAKKVR